MTAVTLGYGINDTDHGTRHAMFAEAAQRKGATAVYGRVELVQVETELLLYSLLPSDVHGSTAKDRVAAFTAGAVRDVLEWRRFEGAVGAAATVSAAPDPLKATYGSRPVSFQVFFACVHPQRWAACGT